MLIKEELVEINQARMLKRLGFHCHVNNYYQSFMSEGRMPMIGCYKMDGREYNCDPNTWSIRKTERYMTEYFSAPTYSLVWQWLEKEHGLYVYETFNEDSKSWEVSVVGKDKGKLFNKGDFSERRDAMSNGLDWVLSKLYGLKK